MKDIKDLKDKFACCCKKNKWSPGGSECVYGFIESVDENNKQVLVKGKWYKFEDVKIISFEYVGYLA